MSSGDQLPRLLGLLLRLANQQWSAEMDEAMRERGVEGLTVAHATVVPFVPPEGIQIGVLAGKAKVRKQTMAQSVEQLEKSGYVERRPDPSDGRASLVFLTAKGQALGPVSRQAGASVEKRWAEVIGKSEVEHLRATLTRLTEPGVS